MSSCTVSSLVVVGAGVIGIEYASMFSALGTRVTVVEKRPQMLEFCDPEVVESLKFHLRDQAVTFRLGEEVDKVEIAPKATITSLASGKRIAADMVMYSAGRQGVTDELDLEKADAEAARLDRGPHPARRAHWAGDHGLRWTHSRAGPSHVIGGHSRCLSFS